MEERILIQGQNKMFDKAWKAMRISLAVCLVCAVLGIIGVVVFQPIVFFLLLIGFIAFILFFVFLYIYLHSTKIIVTDKRVCGISFFRASVNLPLDQISSVKKRGNKFFVSTDSGTLLGMNIPNIAKIDKCINSLLIQRNSIEKNTAPTVVRQATVADELRKYKELLDMGVISQEEFELKKRQLLGL